jgi:hypothetical protein
MINDIEINEPIPKELGSRKGNVIILGGGRTVWQDYFNARTILNSYEIICINDIVLHFKAEPVHHLITKHSNIISSLIYIGLTRRRGKVITHSTTASKDVDVCWDIKDTGGASGLFAAQVAVLLGYEKIVLCGVPMDNSGHYYDPLTPQDNNSTMFNDVSITAWQEMAQIEGLKAKIRSMSGRTMALFNAPTRAWLCQ